MKFDRFVRAFLEHRETSSMVGVLATGSLATCQPWEHVSLAGVGNHPLQFGLG